jgi:polyferredoxin
MRKILRISRIVLAVLFFSTTLLYFFLGDASPESVEKSARVHIAPMLISESAGLLLAWLLATLLLGRVYCSAVCPIGIFTDAVCRVSSLMRRKRVQGYKRPGIARLHILIVYAVCVTLGFVVVPLIMEPWAMFGNITTLFGAGTMETLWARYGYGAAVGVAAGVVSLILVLLYALLRGRGFCNEICPVGAAMSYLSRIAIFKITIDGDKCVSCMKCQEGCKAAAINVASRYVDNSKCLRCFNCVAACGDDAISLTCDRHRPTTPLINKIKARDI